MQPEQKRPWTVHLVLLVGWAVGSGLTACDSPPEEPAPAPVVQADAGFYQEVSWRPDGGALVVSVLDMTPDGGFGYHLLLVPLDGSPPTRITEGPRDYWSAWSPDGVLIAFNGQNGETADITIVGPDGTGRRMLTMDPGNDLQPDWSPDGSRIAFISDRTGTERIWLMAADGADSRLLLDAGDPAQNPRWSPDGRRLAFFETDSTGANSLALVGADGTGYRRLGPGLWPSWDASGDSLVYAGEEGLYQMAADGGGQRLLVPGAIVNGELSLDGRRLAVVEKLGDDVAVVVMRPDGSDRRVLLRRPAPPWA